MQSSNNQSVPEGVPGSSAADAPKRHGHTAMQWFTVAVLCFVNLFNYMDRFIIAGVLTDIQNALKISDDFAGLMQTAFVISYMISAPIFGYLGDRYSRRWIMAAGICLWSSATLIGSFMHTYGWFITFRSFVGVGEASFSTLAPTSISDLFIYKMRSKMLALFYFAIPVGSGMGYIVGSKTAYLAGNWRWAFRVTPVLGIIAVVLILLTIEPKRGESEGSQNLKATSYLEDIKYLIKNRSFMLSTAGFTCVAFVTGALAWWAPKYIHIGFKTQPGNENVTLDDVSFKFGLITMLAGIIGVPLGSILSQATIKRFPKADPLLCSLGLFISVPLLTVAMIIVSKSTAGTFALVFFGQLALNINWAIIADILMYVVVPTRRSTAAAVQILIAHALGDAGSPYLIGVLSETFKKHLRKNENGEYSVSDYNDDDDVDDTFNLEKNLQTTKTFLANKDSNWTKFKALQYALFSTSLVSVLGGVFFLITAAFIIKDRQKARTAARKVETLSPKGSTIEGLANDAF